MHVAVVGGTRGIGLKIVHRLREVLSPKSVIYLTARSAAKGEEARKTVEAAVPEGARIEVKELDITDSASVDAFANGLEALDVAVCNAGFAFKMTDTTAFAEQAQVTNQINYFGTKNVILATLPLIKRSQAGRRIVLVSSTAGQLKGAKKVSKEMKVSSSGYCISIPSTRSGSDLLSTSCNMYRFIHCLSSVNYGL